MTMKFRAHETFFIRKGWISKGMKAIHNDPNAFISKERNPMDTLGIGSNMVKSMRFWMQAVGITEEPSRGRRSQTFTPLGEKIYQHDRYIEEIGTLTQIILISKKSSETLTTEKSCCLISREILYGKMKRGRKK